MHYTVGKKRKRCGKCAGCTERDCGTCKYCLDMKKFGGAGKQKQSCVKGICTPQVHYIMYMQLT